MPPNTLCRYHVYTFGGDRPRSNKWRLDKKNPATLPEEIMGRHYIVYSQKGKQKLNSFPPGEGYIFHLEIGRRRIEINPLLLYFFTPFRKAEDSSVHDINIQLPIIELLFSIARFLIP